MFAKAISAKIYLQTHICKDIFAKAITANIYLRECVIVGRRRSTMCWLCAKWPPRVEVPRIPSPYFGKQGQALIAAAVLTRLARCYFLKLYFSSPLWGLFSSMWQEQVISALRLELPPHEIYNSNVISSLIVSIS